MTNLRRSGGSALRVAVFASGAGGNLKAIMNLAAKRRRLVQVAAMVSDRPNCDAVSIATAAGLPVIARNFRSECGRASDCETPAQRSEYEQRAEAFHDRIDAELQEIERADGPLDLVVLSYGRWIHGRLLERFAGRMINQHPGDLTLLDDGGRRILIGNNPVLAALRHRLPSVRTSTFFVDAGQDSGPILCQGPPLEAKGIPPRQDAADSLENEMKRHSDWPSIICAITLIAERMVDIDQTRRMADGSRGVSIGGVPMSFGGLDLMSDLDHPDPRLVRVCSVVRESLACCLSK